MMNMINFLEKTALVLLILALASLFFADTFIGSLILVISCVCAEVIATIVGIIKKDTPIKFFILGDTLAFLGILLIVSIYYLKRDDIAMILVILMLVFVFVFCTINNIKEHRNK